MEMVTVVNRVKRTLTATFDGEQFDIPAGESQLPKIVVPYAKRQNPLMGSMNPRNPLQVQFLIGVKGTKDPITPVKEDADQIELIDRAEMPGVPHRIKGRTATRFELSEDNPMVDNVAGVSGD